MAVPCEKCQNNYGYTLWAHFGLCDIGKESYEGDCTKAQSYCIKNGQTAADNLTTSYIDTQWPTPTQGAYAVPMDFNKIYTILYRLFWYGVFDYTTDKTVWEMVSSGETPNTSNLIYRYDGTSKVLQPDDYTNFTGAQQNFAITAEQYNKVLEILDITNANIAQGTSLTVQSLQNLKDKLKNYQLHSARCWKCNISSNCSQGCGDCSNTGTGDGCPCGGQGCNDLCSGCNCSLYCSSYG